MNIFTDIHKNNYWFEVTFGKGETFSQTESKSGPGSMLVQTETIRKELPLLFTKYDMKSVLDAPCGDLNWMKEILQNDKHIKYIGVDIVNDLILENKTKFPEYCFQTLNIVSDPLPQSDVILCRDCLVHLSINEVFQAIENFKKSGSTYLLTTTFTGSEKTNRTNQMKMVTGLWQPINLFAHPFNFPPPICIINEHCTEANNEYTDKSLALWKLYDLNTKR